jgi:hypothetical protein
MTKKRLNLRSVAMIACLAVTIMFSGCEKKSDLKGENEIIYGKWQLKTISPLNVPPGVDLMLVDFSPMNIIYEFKTNNVVRVSGRVNDIDGVFEKGKHFYNVTNSNISNGLFVTNLPQHIVKINTISYCFCIGYMSDDITLSLAHDESNSHFTFVKK